MTTIEKVKSNMDDVLAGTIANVILVGITIVILLSSFCLCSGVAAGLAYRLFIWISGVGY